MNNETSTRSTWLCCAFMWRILQTHSFLAQPKPCNVPVQRRWFSFLLLPHVEETNFLLFSIDADPSPFMGVSPISYTHCPTFLFVPYSSCINLERRPTAHSCQLIKLSYNSSNLTSEFHIWEEIFNGTAFLSSNFFFFFLWGPAVVSLKFASDREKESFLQSTQILIWN